MMVMILLALLGVVCRVRLYLARTSFWNDEAFIVLNVEDHPASAMMGPLDYNQAAPPAFMWVERAAFVWLGNGEYALRLIPLVCGVTALAVFARLAWRELAPPAAAFAVGLFAFTDKLIDYSAQVKQYSGDGLVAVVLIALALAWKDRRRAALRFIILSVVAATAVWISHPAAIVFAALSLALAIPCAREGWAGWIAWVGGNIVVAASFGILYHYSIVREQDPFLYKFWAPGFPPTDRLWQVPGWLCGRLLELARQPLAPLGALTGILAMLGVVELALSRRLILLSACIGPIVLTVAAAFDRKYPFSPSRLTIYLLPGLVLLCGAGALFLMRRLPRPWRYWSVAAPAALLGCMMAAAGGRVFHPHFYSHIRPVVDYVRVHRQPGDALFLLGVPKERHLEFYCYWRHPEPPVFAVLPGPEQLPFGRFWLIFPFAPGHPAAFIESAVKEAGSVARQDGPSFFIPEGGAAYLFDRPAATSQPAAAAAAGGPSK